MLGVIADGVKQFERIEREDPFKQPFFWCRRGTTCSIARSDPLPQVIEPKNHEEESIRLLCSSISENLGVPTDGSEESLRRVDIEEPDWDIHMAYPCACDR